MPAVALTDHGSLAGAVELYREAGKVGVKPLIGCEVYVADDRRAQPKGYAHLTLLAEDNAGYANLIKLSSAGYLEGYYYKPRVDWELLERHCARARRALGLPLRPGLQGARGEPARRRARRPRPAGPGLRPRLDLRRDAERRPRDPAADQPVARRSSPGKPACRSSRPATSTTCRHEDARAHEALLCIQSGDSLKNPNHWKFDTDQFFFKTPAEMALDFPGHEEAMRRTLEIAERCNVDARAREDPAAEVPAPGGPGRASTTWSSSARKACKSATTGSRRSCRSASASSSRRSRRWASPTTS